MKYADRWLDAYERKADAGARSTPLTASQHILHLLLTVFTAGLWAPVWFIRAWQGNRVQHQPPGPAR